jgi:hypothetical protein
LRFKIGLAHLNIEMFPRKTKEKQNITHVGANMNILIMQLSNYTIYAVTEMLCLYTVQYNLSTLEKILKLIKS